jgi:hypothetical protein
MPLFFLLLLLLWFGTPISLVLLGELVDHLLAARQRRRVARVEHRIARGLCVRCGYDLRGCQGCCSECGKPIPLPFSASAFFANK